MRPKDQEKQNAIIKHAIKENGGKDDSGRYQYVIEALRHCKLKLDYPTNRFPRSETRTPVSYTFYCNDEEYYIELNNNSKFVARLCFDLLGTNYEMDIDENGEPCVSIKHMLDEVEEIPSEVKYTFEKCQQTLIDNLEKAEFFIFAAVAWFTNPTIMDVLKRKASEGVLIIILLDRGKLGEDEINFNFISSQGQLPFLVHPCDKNHMEPGNKYRNFMHQKFCIIDGKVVVSGTYNWTKKADYNDETIDVNDNKEAVRSFMKEFLAAHENVDGQ